jgi:hypothetical protein
MEGRKIGDSRQRDWRSNANSAQSAMIPDRIEGFPQLLELAQCRDSPPVAFIRRQAARKVHASDCEQSRKAVFRHVDGPRLPVGAFQPVRKSISLALVTLSGVT